MHSKFFNQSAQKTSIFSSQRNEARGLFFQALVCFLLAFSEKLPAIQISDPITLSSLGQNASCPQIAIDFFGNAIAVWHRFDGKHLVVQAAVREAGGKWQGSPDNLSGKGRDSWNPQLAVDAFGNAAVVFESFDGERVAIECAYRAFGRGWQSAPEVISLRGCNAKNPKIAIDSLGNATAVWECAFEEGSMIQTSSRSMWGGWSFPCGLSLAGWSAKNPQIAIDVYDNVSVVWQARDALGEEIQCLTRLCQDEWPAVPETLSSCAVSNAHPKIVIDAGGDATVVWSQYDGRWGAIMAATRVRGGAWEKQPQRLSLPGCNSLIPFVACDAQGNVTVIWEGENGRRERAIQASSRACGGGWQSIPDELSPPGDKCVHPRIGTDSFGNVVVAWNNLKGFSRIFIAFKRFGEKWALNQREVASPGRSLFEHQIAFDRFGGGALVWVIQDHLSSIQTADF